MIQKKSLPPSGALRPHVISIFSMSIIAVAISASCNTASLFCNGTDEGGNVRLVDRDSSVAMYVKVAYVLTYVVPAGAMNIFNVVGFGISLYHIYTNVREILPLLRRLIVNNLIIMMLYIPAAVLFFATTNDMAINIGSMLIASAGVWFSIAYFYFAIYVDNLMPFPCLVSSDVQLRSLLVSPSSSTRPSSSTLSMSLIIKGEESISYNSSSMFEMIEDSSSVSDFTGKSYESNLTLV